MNRKLLLLPAIVLSVVIAASSMTGIDATCSSSSMAQEQVIATLQVGSFPHGLAVSEGSNRVYVANMNGNTISVIDVSTLEVVETLEARRSPRDVAVIEQIGRVYVASLGLYDMSSQRVRLLGPLSLRLYRPSFALSILDAHGGQLLAETIVGTNPWVVGASGAAQRVYVGNYADGTVSVVDGRTGDVLATISMGKWRTPESIAVDDRAGRVYITNTMRLGPVELGSGHLLVLDMKTNEVLKSARVGRRADVAVDPLEDRIYVTDPGRNVLSLLDASSLRSIADVEVGANPCAVAVNGLTGRVYVTNRGDDTVTVIDAGSGQVLSTLAVGDSPASVAVSERTGRVFVTDAGDDTVTVLGVPKAAHQ